MKQVLIIQNIEREGPAMMGDILQRLRIPHEIFRAFDYAVYPDPAKYAVVIVLGGPDSANDETEKMSGQILFAKKCIDLRIPYLGVCLGHQFLLNAAGGAVHKNVHGGKQVKEIGFSDGHEPYTVSLTDEGMQDVLFNGINKVFPVFQLHENCAIIIENFLKIAELR